jgi:hypothetical protein
VATFVGMMSQMTRTSYVVLKMVSEENLYDIIGLYSKYYMVILLNRGK